MNSFAYDMNSSCNRARCLWTISQTKLHASYQNFIKLYLINLRYQSRRMNTGINTHWWIHKTPFVEHWAQTLFQRLEHLVKRRSILRGYDRDPAGFHELAEEIITVHWWEAIESNHTQMMNAEPTHIKTKVCLSACSPYPQIHKPTQMM